MTDLYKKPLEDIPDSQIGRFHYSRLSGEKSIYKYHVIRIVPGITVLGAVSRWAMIGEMAGRLAQGFYSCLPV